MIFNYKQCSVKKKSEKKQLMINQEGEIDSDEERKELEKDVYELRTQKIQKTFVSKISTMSAGQIFGEEEVVKKTTRNYDTTCESVEGVAVFFNAHVFWSLIYNNPSYKVILDDKVKMQDIIKQRQMNYIKSSMDDYDHYLLGKQYAQGGNETTENEEDTQSSIVPPPPPPMSRHISKVGSQEKNKKKKQQQNDEIKIAIEKIPILDLQRINQQAKQFNQYAFDPKEEKFNNPNEQELLEGVLTNGNTTNRNQFKMAMRQSSTINNQCQLEFIKLQGPIHLPSGGSTTRAFIGNGNNNSSQQTSQINLNTHTQGTPYRQKYGSSSQEELDKLIATPKVPHEYSPRQEDINQKNKLQNNNLLLLPLNTVINNSFNTPTNANTNANSNTQTNQNSNNTNSNNNNNNELFDLIMAHNSKKYGKQFIRMKKFIQEGDKMQEMNRKKYSLQNLFGGDRSTPRCFIPQLTTIINEKSNSFQSPFSPSSFKQISQFLPGSTSTTKDYTSQNQFQAQQSNSQNIQKFNNESQDDMIDTSRQQTMNFLTNAGKQPTSTPQTSNQNSPQNAGYIQGGRPSLSLSQIKSFQPSSFAQAVMQHSARTTQNVISNINQQLSKKSTEENQINQFAPPKVNIINSSQEYHPIQNNSMSPEKKVNHEVKRPLVNVPNLQLLLSSASNLDNLDDTTTQNENQNNHKSEQIANTHEIKEYSDDYLSTTREKQNQKTSRERLVLTDRDHKAKTSYTTFRIGKTQQQKPNGYFQNKILQGQMSSSSNPQITQETSESQASPLYQMSSRNAQSSQLQKHLVPLSFSSGRKQATNYKEFKVPAQTTQNIKMNNIRSESPPLFIEVDSNVRVTPMQFYAQKKTSITNNFIDTPQTTDKQILNQYQFQQNSNHAKHNSLTSITHLSQPSSHANSQLAINETQQNPKLNVQIKEKLNQNIQEINPNVMGAFESISLPMKSSQRIRIKSDLPHIQKIFKEEQVQKRNSHDQHSLKQIQGQQQSNTSNTILSPRLVLKQSRPLYHDSNSSDNKVTKQQQHQQSSKSHTHLQEQLLQKHIQAKFQIQDTQRISSFIEKIADSQKNKKQQLPQQYVFSYSSNQNPVQSNNSSYQHVKSISDLPFLQSIYKSPATTRNPQTQEKQYFLKKDNQFQTQRKSQNYETNQGFFVKSSFEKDKQGKDQTPSSKSYQICEDLGYNFVKSKIS